MKKVALLAGCMAVAGLFLVNMAHAGDEGCMENVKAMYSECVESIKKMDKIDLGDGIKITDDCRTFGQAAVNMYGRQKNITQAEINKIGKLHYLCCENVKRGISPEEVFGQLQSLCK